MRIYGAHPCEQNGRLDGGKYRVSTRAELAEWLNSIARKVGIARSPSNPNGYFATEQNIG